MKVHEQEHNDDGERLNENCANVLRVRVQDSVRLGIGSSAVGLERIGGDHSSNPGMDENCTDLNPGMDQDCIGLNPGMN